MIKQKVLDKIDSIVAENSPLQHTLTAEEMFGRFEDDMEQLKEFIVKGSED